MQLKLPQNPSRGGAYILRLRIKRNLALPVGALGTIFLSTGYYVYIGSARRSIASRVARHRRLAESKTGTRHWHIDYLLSHPDIEIVSIEEKPGFVECAVAKKIASRPNTSVPVRRFGATDCRSGCEAHLFRIKPCKRANV